MAVAQAVRVEVPDRDDRVAARGMLGSLTEGSGTKGQATVGQTGVSEEAGGAPG